MTTRRQLLAAAVAAPIAAVPVPSTAAQTFVCGPTTSPEWDAAVDRLSVAEAAVSDYYRDVFEPADALVDQRKAAVKALIEQVPHYTTKATFETVGKGIMSLTTSRSIDVNLAKKFVANPEIFDGEGVAIEDWHRALHELQGAVDRRNAEIAKIEADNPIGNVDPDIRAGLDRVEAESLDAFSAVVDFPVATLADLRAKIRYLKGQDYDLGHDDLLADLARIFGEG